MVAFHCMPPEHVLAVTLLLCSFASKSVKVRERAREFFMHEMRAVENWELRALRERVGDTVTLNRKIWLKLPLIDRCMTGGFVLLPRYRFSTDRRHWWAIEHREHTLWKCFHYVTIICFVVWEGIAFRCLLWSWDRIYVILYKCKLSLVQSKL